MSRSGYSDDCDDDTLALGRYRGQVASAIRGKRGQAFLRELADAMDAMPAKVLIAERLVDKYGRCCAIGVVCQARGISVEGVDYSAPDEVGKLVGIASQMAAEIEYENDEWGGNFGMTWSQETPQQRWIRMRKWVTDNLVKEVKNG